MLWAIVMAGGAGLFVGLIRLQMPAVFAASILIAITCLIAVPFTELSLLKATGVGFLLLCALQWGYLVGLMLACMLSHVIDRLMPMDVVHQGLPVVSSADPARRGFLPHERRASD